MKKPRKPVKPKRKAAEGTIEFLCHAPEAQSVFLAGSFNDWNPNAHPMICDDKGFWQTSLKLPPGRYEFKFVIDGEWCCESGCDGPHTGCTNRVTNEFGTMNRVLEVGPSA